ncbi:MAG TPA: ABC transporter substrate-binding protein [Acetobacteraceae bacterium]|jgi:peptide/nickel transport system substrate-binding protein
MKNPMRRLVLATACLTALGAAVAPLPASAQTLNIGLRQDPDLLDPTLGSSYVGRIVYSAMCDKLFDLDAKLNIVPQLATSYSYDDPTHLLIHLRSGVLFQDGTKMDADAVKTSLLRHMTAKGSMRAGEVSVISSVEVVDPLTVRLVLKTPSSPLLAQFTDRAGIIMSPKALAEEGDAKFGLHPVCAGPYSFVERAVQDHITLKRFPDYWNAKDYNFDQIVYRSLPNSSVRLANLQAGSLDLVEQIVPTDIDAVRKDPRLKLAIDDSLAYTGITFNTGNGPRANTDIGKNALVRQAFELAIDKTALMQVVYNGLFTPTAQANPPDSPMYIQSIVSPPRDVEKAKALLKQAGVKLPVEVELTTTNEPDQQQLGEVIQSMAAEAGFHVTPKPMEFAASLQNGYAGDFQAYLIAWSGRSDADGNMWAFLHTGGTFNYGHYSNANMDTLLDQARGPVDVAARRVLYTQVWAQERQDMPLIYLYNPKNVVGMKKNLMGFQQVPDGLIRLGGVAFQ